MSRILDVVVEDSLIYVWASSDEVMIISTKFNFWFILWTENNELYISTVVYFSEDEPYMV